MVNHFKTSETLSRKVFQCDTDHNSVYLQQKGNLSVIKTSAFHGMTDFLHNDTKNVNYLGIPLKRRIIPQL